MLYLSDDLIYNDNTMPTKSYTGWSNFRILKIGKKLYFGGILLDLDVLNRTIYIHSHSIIVILFTL